MPANKYALLRYRIIDRCLRHTRKPFPTKDDLRKACEEALYGSDEGARVSASTIDKDLWAMRNESELGFYAPIRFSKENGGYYYEDPNYTIAEIPLNDEDLHAIRAAAETLYQFRDVPLFSQFEHAIEKIMDRMRISAADTKSRAHEVIRFERMGSYAGSEYLHSLFTACAEQLDARIEYQKFGSDQTSTYHFAPYIIKEYRSRWYVIGEDLERRRIITLSFDRIRHMLLGTSRVLPSIPFNAQKFFSHAIGITVTDSDPVKVVLEFSPKLAPYVLSQPLHSSQTAEEFDNGKLRVTLYVQITIELVTTILSYAQDVLVVEPIQLKNQVKTALRECLDQYEKK